MTKRKNDKTPPNPVGRPRINMSFLEARELVRNEKLGSKMQYFKWWNFNRPARIPKRPESSYRKDWLGWNDFLGNNNPFPAVRRSFRPFADAKTYVHQLALNNRSEWLSYAKTTNKPKDIPSRPDLVYRNDWFTWTDFLGADIASVKRNIESSKAVFFIIQNMNRPNNVFQFGITLEGKQAVIEHQGIQQYKIVALFHCDIEFGWMSFAQEMGRMYYDGGRSDEYVISNINEFIFQIDDFVERIRR